LWGANLETCAINWVELPGRHDRDNAGHQFDVHKLAGRSLLALNTANSLPVLWMPTIVDYDIRPDMGRMTAQLSWDAKISYSPDRMQVAKRLQMR